MSSSFSDETEGGGRGGGGQMYSRLYIKYPKAAAKREPWENVKHYYYH